MRRYLTTVGLGQAPVVAAAALVAALVAVPAHAQDAQATFIGGDGEAIGSASLTPTATGGVLIEIEVAGLPADNWVAFHVHETGVCDHSTGHTSAGGHFNPSEAPHGFLVDGGPHAGDMPNIWVDAEGNARVQVFNPLVSLDEGDAAIRGRALMIHAGSDDYTSQPTGDAGDRLACAVIE